MGRRLSRGIVVEGSVQFISGLIRQRVGGTEYERLRYLGIIDGPVVSRHHGQPGRQQTDKYL
jgi:hypothetical protein